MTVEYTEDQKRAAEYIGMATNQAVGGGDDPIGFLLASHAYTMRENLKLKVVADAAADCITDDRGIPGGVDAEVFFKMGSHRRIRLADVLKALKD